jgi:hypothetical protein
MRLREVVAGLAISAVASPLAVLAQQSPERVRRIDVLMDLAADDPEARARLEVFSRLLKKSRVSAAVGLLDVGLMERDGEGRPAARLVSCLIIRSRLVPAV